MHEESYKKRRNNFQWDCMYRKEKQKRGKNI